MPSITPINKQKLVSTIFNFADINYKLIQDDNEPVTWVEILLGISLKTGLNKRIVQEVCNDMIQIEWIENDEMHDTVVITLKGKAQYKDIQETVATYEHAKLLRQNSRK